MYLINSPVVRAESLKFKEEGVQSTVREVLLPWFNAFRFFVQQVKLSSCLLVQAVVALIVVVLVARKMYQKVEHVAIALWINFEIPRERLTVFPGVMCVSRSREMIGSASGDDVWAAFRTQPGSCCEVD